MNELAFFDRKDYDQTLPRIIRNSANAIIITEGKVAMIFVGKHNFYAFPGGGVEDGETLIDALIREIEEETGLLIIPSTIVEFGKIVEIQKDKKTNGIYERHDHYFLCDVESTSTARRLSKNEIENGHRFVYIFIDEATSTNELHMKQGLNWTEGILYILKLLKMA